MALTLDSWPGNGDKRQYPWSEWFDGRTWQITKGADFDVSVDTMQSIIRSTARRKHKKVRTMTDEQSVTFQASEP